MGGLTTMLVNCCCTE